MKGGGAMVMIPNNNKKSNDNNFMRGLQKNMKEIEDVINGYRGWLCKQPLLVEVALDTTANVIGGAAIGALLGSLPNNNPVFSVFRGGRLLQARDIAVMKGVEACLSCVLKRVKGQREEDLQTSMLAAFGSGVVFSLVTDMGRPNLAVNAVGSGILFALIDIGFFQLKQKSSPPPVEHTNLEKGLLTDSTLTLVTDSALKDMEIPLQIGFLDHIKSDSKLRKKRNR